jgi:hypothetical protein
MKLNRSLISDQRFATVCIEDLSMFLVVVSMFVCINITDTAVKTNYSYIHFVSETKSKTKNVVKLLENRK